MTGIQKQIYDMLMKSQFWLPEQMLAFQHNQFCQFLNHGRAKVPFTGPVSIRFSVSVEPC